MTSEIQQAMNLIDAQADRLVEIAMRSKNLAEAKIIRDYAENLIQLAAECYQALKQAGVSPVSPEQAPKPDVQQDSDEAQGGVSGPSATVPKDKLFVVAVDGDGAMCVIVPQRDLHGTVHALACTCDAEWDECETEWVSSLCATLDNDDYWTFPYPDKERFSWTQTDAEESPITVTRVTGFFAFHCKSGASH